MPAIKIYKGKGIAIPVSEAVEAKGYQCPWTKKLFLTKKSYVSHLKTLREFRMHSRARANRERKLAEDFMNQSSFNDIVKWVELHSDFFYDRIKKTTFSGGMRCAREDFFIEISHLDLHWSDSLSNSHSAPRGKPQNWDRKAVDKNGVPIPNGYPGWGGRIEFKVPKNAAFESRVFGTLGIHTGTGGGSGRDAYTIYGYDVKIFAEDWPDLFKAEHEAWEKKYVFNIVGDRPKPEFSRTQCGKPEYFRT